MLQDIDLRLQAITKTLYDIVLPALPEAADLPSIEAMLLTPAATTKA